VLRPAVAHCARIGYKDDGLTNPKALWYLS
jgi:hypothetical protein